MSRENYELGLPIIEKSGVANKIDFREGQALPLLDELLQDVRLHNFFNNFICFVVVLYIQLDFILARFTNLGYNKKSY